MTSPRTAPCAARDGWPGAALVGFAFFVTMLGATLPTPLYPVYEQRLGFGELTVTLVFATYAVGVIGGLLLLGHWSDQLGRKPMVVAGLVLSALSAVCFVLPLSLGWLYLGRILSGVSAGIFTGTATAYVMDLAPEGQSLRASLLAAGVNMGGLGGGPLLAGVLVEYAPLPTRLSYLVDLALIAAGLVAVALVAETVDRAERPSLRPRRLAVPAEARSVFVTGSIAGFAGFAVLGVFTSVSPAFVGQVLGIDNAAVIGLVASSLLAGSVVGQFATVPLGPERALPGGCALLVVGVGVIAASLATASLALLVVGAVVAGVGQGGSFRAAIAVITSASPDDQRGSVTSVFFLTVYVAISLPVVGVGASADALGLRPTGLVFSGLVAGLALVALVLLRRGGRVAAA